MDQEIIRSRTYNVKEVSAFLRVSENLAESMLRSGEIRSVRVGREYRVTGLALMDFLQITVMLDDPRRLRLVNDLNNTIERLHEENKNHPDQDLGVLLHQAINLQADEGSLYRILQDLQAHLKRLQEKTQQDNDLTPDPWDPAKTIRRVKTHLANTQGHISPYSNEPHPYTGGNAIPTDTMPEDTSGKTIEPKAPEDSRGKV